MLEITSAVVLFWTRFTPQVKSPLTSSKTMMSFGELTGFGIILHYHRVLQEINIPIVSVCRCTPCGSLVPCSCSLILLLIWTLRFLSGAPVWVSVSVSFHHLMKVNIQEDAYMFFFGFTFLFSFSRITNYRLNVLYLWLECSIGNAPRPAGLGLKKHGIKPDSLNIADNEDY